MNERQKAGSTAASRGRLLGQVMTQAKVVQAAQENLDRLVVRAARECSQREIAAAAGFGSHHRVSEIIERARRTAIDV